MEKVETPCGSKPASFRATCRWGEPGVLPSLMNPVNHALPPSCGLELITTEGRQRSHHGCPQTAPNRTPHLYRQSHLLSSAPKPSFRLTSNSLSWSHPQASLQAVPIPGRSRSPSLLVTLHFYTHLKCLLFCEGFSCFPLCSASKTQPISSFI